MLVDSLVMAAGVTLTSIVALGSNVPVRNRSSKHHDASGTRGVGMLDVVLIMVLAVAGSFAFNVLAGA